MGKRFSGEPPHTSLPVDAPQKWQSINGLETTLPSFPPGLFLDNKLQLRRAARTLPLQILA